jgi:hypothetical protein
MLFASVRPKVGMAEAQIGRSGACVAEPGYDHIPRRAIVQPASICGGTLGPLRRGAGDHHTACAFPPRDCQHWPEVADRLRISRRVEVPRVRFHVADLGRPDDLKLSEALRDDVPLGNVPRTLPLAGQRITESKTGRARGGACGIIARRAWGCV